MGVQNTSLLAFFLLSVLSTVSLGQFGSNLVRNAGFEEIVQTSPGSIAVEGLGLNYALSEWESDGVASLNRYDGLFPPTTGVPAGGETYFVIGARTAMTTLYQVIDLSFASGSIEKGEARYVYGSHLGSYKAIDPLIDPNQEDIATIRVRFLDSNGGVLDSQNLVGPNFPSEVGAPETRGTFLGYFQSGGVVPVGTVAVDFVIELVRDPEPNSPLDVNNAAVELPRFIVWASDCQADLNGDGMLDFLDISVFIAAFTGLEPTADLSGDGEYDFLDISAFIASYSSGCP